MDIATEMDQAIRMIGLFGASSNGNELCRRLASDEVFGAGTHGTQLFALTNSGSWQLLGSYGKLAYPDGKETQFDENLMTLAARSRSIEASTIELDGQPFDVVSCVLLRDALPVGALVRVSVLGSYSFNPTHGTLKAIQDSGGLFLDSIGFRTVASAPEAKDASPDDMTARQVQILIEMAHGKTNLVIAQEMILSESSIKQESVKIFRAMGVGTRQQAVLKARTLGLLPDGLELKV